MKIEDYLNTLPESILSGQEVQLPEETFREIFKFANLGSDDVFYHLGCGDGRGLVIAKEEFGVKKIIGIDNSEEKIVSAKKTFSENVKEGKAALPPCHAFFQFYVADNKLSCQMYQRSADVFLGVPFNIASYSLLTFMIAQVCELQVGEFIHTLGDAHIYLNHLEQVELQLSRDPLELPKLKLNPIIKSIEDFKYEDIEIVDYKFHPPIKGKISI